MPQSSNGETQDGSRARWQEAIVTGGSKGIGRALANTLAAEGCHVAICARNAEGVASAVEALKGRGVKAFGRALDVTDRDALVGCRGEREGVGSEPLGLHGGPRRRW